MRGALIGAPRFFFPAVIPKTTGEITFSAGNAGRVISPMVFGQASGRLKRQNDVVAQGQQAKTRRRGDSGRARASLAQGRYSKQ